MRFISFLAVTAGCYQYRVAWCLCLVEQREGSSLFSASGWNGTARVLCVVHPPCLYLRVCLSLLKTCALQQRTECCSEQRSIAQLGEG